MSMNAFWIHIEYWFTFESIPAANSGETAGKKLVTFVCCVPPSLDDTWEFSVSFGVNDKEEGAFRSFLAF